MIILGIETSCDETAAAVLQKDGNRITILSNVVASSAQLQAKYGGVIPEQAAREQIKSIIPVITEALSQAFPNTSPTSVGDPEPPKYEILAVQDDRVKKIDAIAVTYGPGLIGSLLVGVETAKTLSLVWNKPLIPVNHLIGHFYANWISQSQESRVKSQEKNKPRLSPPLASLASGGTLATSHYPKFPCIGLLVSGGHTDLVLFEEHGKYKYLGGTRDDAAGECFDKCARLLALPYPGGPSIAKLAAKGDPARFSLPRPMIDSKNFDFSFSGLKTAVANLLSSQESKPTWEEMSDLAASIEAAIVDVLVAKTIRAAQNLEVDQIMVAGGVASNQKLVSDLKLKIENLKLKIKLHVPPPKLCTDNAAMVASAAFFQKPVNDPLTIQADPNLALSQ